jgi:hypothetical protein
MANSIYGSWTGAQLYQQIRVRVGQGSKNFPNITEKSSSDEMINALIADDEIRAKAEPELPPGTSKLPKIERAKSVYLPSPGIPMPEHFRDGHARRDFGHHAIKDPKDANKSSLPKLNTGELFAVCKHEPDGYGNTVTCMNSVHTWQGTDAQFRQYFTAVDLPDQTVSDTTDKTAILSKRESAIADLSKLDEPGLDAAATKVGVKRSDYKSRDEVIAAIADKSK